MCFIVLPRSPAPLPPSAPLINYCALTYAPLLACAQSHNLQHCTRGRTACINPPSFLAHPRTFPLASSANDARCAILSHLDFTRNLGFIRHMSLHTDEKKDTFSMWVKWRFWCCVLYRTTDWALYLKGLSLVRTLFYSNIRSSALGVWINKILVHLDIESFMD